MHVHAFRFICKHIRTYRGLCVFRGMAIRKYSNSWSDRQGH